MKRPLQFWGCVAVLLLAAQGLLAQRPSLKVGGDESPDVSLQQLDIQVTINGTLAVTTWTMIFKNHSNRVLEGELTFPLGEGIDVSRYALDINGRLREAVPVEKSRGAVVFESIERRRVDPGLLEKLEGNSFRTRIYPFNPGATRTILIGYEEQLAFSKDGSLQYRLPLGIDKQIEAFNIELRVLQSQTAPLLEEDMNGALQFTKVAAEYRISKRLRNYTPDHPLAINLPKQPNSTEVLMQKKGTQYYYLVNSFMELAPAIRPLPHQLSIVWDVSLSSTDRNRDKELQLLDDYISLIGDAQINLVCFSNSIVSQQQFLVTGGNSNALRKHLTKLAFDGATNLSSINFAQLPGDEILLFSDGHNTFLSDQLRLGKKPVHCITSSVKTDFPQLQFITQKTGGSLINLSGKTVDDAIQLLQQSPLRFLGIKANEGLKEHYPSMPVIISNGFSLAGIAAKPYDTIVLLFGYGNKPIREKTIILDYDKQMAEALDVSRVWAQKKISELNVRFEENKEEIGKLGKRYGIATRNTSLIVLESVQDYITYNIEPPAELQKEYAGFLKLRNGRIHEQQKQAKDNASRHMKELKEWYFAERKPLKPKSVVTTPAPPPQTNAASPQPRSVIRSNHAPQRGTNPDSSGAIAGTVFDEYKEPILGAVVQVFREGRAQGGEVTDEDGKYKIRNLAPATNYELRVNYASYRSVTMRNLLVAPDRITYQNFNLDPGTAALEEVVVREYKVPLIKRDEPGSTTTYTAEQISKIPTRNTSDVVSLGAATYQAKNGQAISQAGARSGNTVYIIDGLQVSGSAGTHVPPTGASRNGNNDREVAIDTAADFIANYEEQEVTDSTDDLLLIRRAPRDRQYELYLSLRAKQHYRPTFFLWVADYFFNSGREELGVRILSNIAELGIEDYELYKMMGYKLREIEQYPAAVYCFKKVLDWRPAEPQSFRDYGLALEDAGYYQRAFDTLYTALHYEFTEEQMRLYKGYQAVLLTEINCLLSRHSSRIDPRDLDRNLVAPMPMDVRVVLNWNMSETDVDLWVTDPDSEKCFYSHRETAMGGQLLSDFTDGFGPEQFQVRKAKSGTYIVQANYYGDRVQKIAGPTTILAEIFMHYGTPQQERQLLTLQLDKEGDREVFIGEFVFR